MTFNNAMLKQGSANKSAKLTERQVLNIRKTNPTTTWEFSMVAKSYGVSPQTIKKIILRETWKHVGESREPVSKP